MQRAKNGQDTLEEQEYKRLSSLNITSAEGYYDFNLTNNIASKYIKQKHDRTTRTDKSPITVVTLTYSLKSDQTSRPKYQRINIKMANTCFLKTNGGLKKKKRSYIGPKGKSKQILED